MRYWVSGSEFLARVPKTTRGGRVCSPEGNIADRFPNYPPCFHGLSSGGKPGVSDEAVENGQAAARMLMSGADVDLHAWRMSFL